MAVSLVRRILGREIQPRASLAYQWLFVLMVAASGISLANQGWNSRFISFDMLIYIDDALKFIADGQIPQKGTLTSFASYSPPGLTWLFIPGAYIFDDPRIFESIGAGILYGGTLAGIFLLASWAFGLQCAFVSVALWGLSELGLQFADTTGARGHPFFYVWMLYFAAQWVHGRKSRYLTAAITVWALGMYCMMEIAPAILILPAVWLYCRPPLRAQQVIVAGVLSAIVWFPYLHFQVTRGFSDLSSQITRQRILPTDFAKTWCDPGLLPSNWMTNRAPSDRSLENMALSTEAQSAATGLSAILSRANVILRELLIANYSRAVSSLGLSIFLLLVTAATMLLLIASPTNARASPLHLNKNRISLWLKWLGINLAFCSVVLNELTLTVLSPDNALQTSTVTSIRSFQLVCFILAVVLLVCRERVTGAISRLMGTSEIFSSDASGVIRGKLVVIGLAVPWLILLLLTEEERPQRLWWLWPLQTMTLTAAATFLAERLGLSKPWRWAGSLVLVGILLPNSLLSSRLTAWADDGWVGKEADEIRVVDHVAGLIKSGQEDTAAIGYSTLVWPFMAQFHAADPRYRVGADFNLFLKMRHGIINTNRCPEGISPDDSYRILQSSRDAGPHEVYIPAPIIRSFRIVAEFGSFQIITPS